MQEQKKAWVELGTDGTVSGGGDSCVGVGWGEGERDGGWREGGRETRRMDALVK